MRLPKLLPPPPDRLRAKSEISIVLANAGSFEGLNAVSSLLICYCSCTSWLGDCRACL